MRARREHAVGPVTRRQRRSLAQPCAACNSVPQAGRTQRRFRRAPASLLEQPQPILLGVNRAAVGCSSRNVLAVEEVVQPSTRPAIGFVGGCRKIECRNLDVGDGEHQ